MQNSNLRRIRRCHGVSVPEYSDVVSVVETSVEAISTEVRRAHRVSKPPQVDFSDTVDVTRAEQRRLSR